MGNSYRLDEGFIVVEHIQQITATLTTGELARPLGFRGIADLLKVAKHGPAAKTFILSSFTR